MSADDDEELGDGRNAPRGEADTSFQLIPNWAARLVYVSSIVVCAALLAFHSANWDRVRVDTTTIALIIALGLLPLAPYVRWVKWGSFEARIDRAKVAELKRDARELPPPAPHPGSGGPLSLSELAERDPQLALAKLRIDLEQALRTLAGGTSGSRQPSLRRLVVELSDEGRVPAVVVGPLQDVLALANQAVHGQLVRPSDAREIVQVGAQVLGLLEAELPREDGAGGLANRGGG
jgi:hypothetical protein